LRVDILPWGSRHSKEQTFSRARWICSSCEPFLYGPAHGHQIGKHIQRTTNDFLQTQHGSLYPALHRLERRGWVTSKWETGPDSNREFKYYRLTDKGKKQLVVEESQWKQMTEAVARVMWPTAEDS
jgi:PadR family transcriptional regulator, regulatory protein PadR